MNISRFTAFTLFTCASLLPALGVDWNLDRWVGVSGSRLSNIESKPEYPNNPLLRQQITGELQWDTSWGSNYASRVRTVLTVPASHAGPVYFWIYGDDETRLSIAPNNDRDALTAIAHVPYWTGVREWDKYIDDQRSEPMTLVAGQQYYLELVHKEGGGGDHFGVGWTTTVDGTPVVIPADVLSSVENVPAQSGVLVSAGSDRSVYFPRTTIQLFGQAVKVELASTSLTYAWTSNGGANVTISDPTVRDPEITFAASGVYQFTLTATTNDGESGSDTLEVVVNDPLHPNAGSATQAYWFEMSTDALESLDDVYTYPTNPDAVQTVTELAGPVNLSNRYVSRTTGLLLIPETARYRFYTTANEAASFRLTLAGESTEVSKVPQAVGSTDFTTYPEQRSAWIDLNAGDAIPFELLFSDNWGSDHHRVFWEKEGTNVIEAIQGEFIAPDATSYSGIPEISNETSTFVVAGPDQDLYDPVLTTELDAFFQRRSGDEHTALLWSADPSNGVVFADAASRETSVNFPAPGSYDLTFSVITPSQTYSDTLTVTVHPALSANTGLLTREVWLGRTLNSIDELRADSRFPNNPDIVDAIQSFEGPRNWSSRYGTRVHGFIQVPVTGEYRFYLSADEQATFSLSTSEDPAGLVELCSLNTRVSYGNFDTHPSQRSVLVPLVAGQRYYAELLHIEYYSSDHFQVAWTLGDGTEPQVINASFVEPIGSPALYDANLRYYTYAGDDRTYYWPHQESVLFGEAMRVAGDSSDFTTTWTQLSGPASNISAPDELETPITFSGPGTYVYQLGLTVEGNTHIDTVQIDVLNPVSGDTGFLTRSVWLDIYGDEISDLLTEEGTLPAPTFQDLLPGVEPPQDFTDYYGTRLAGYLTVPVAGDYQFWIAGNSAAELRLSTDSSRANLQAIADLTRSSSFRQWTRYDSQESVIISLEADTPYFIEAIHKEHNGTDHLSIAMEGPATNGREVISRGFISPETSARAHDPELELVLGKDRILIWPNNEISLAALAYDFNDGPQPITYQWSSTNNEVVIASPSSPLSTFTFPGPGLYELTMVIQDGLNSRTDSLLVTVQDPLAANTGLITREFFRGISGYLVENLTDNPAFPESPTFRDTLQSFETPYNIENNYGQRLYGLLSVPETGDYEFHIASDDQSELFLNPTGSAEGGKQVIAYVSYAVGRYQWERREGQVSAPITLTAGQSYYIEALHKQSGNVDHLAVGFRKAGTDAPIQVIPGAMLSPLNAEGLVNDDSMIVEAGPAQKYHWPISELTLAGSVIDRQPGPTPVAHQWSVASIVGDHSADDVIFDHPTELDTKVRFPGPGKYTLKLTATDGQSVVSDEVICLIFSPLAEDAGSILVEAYHNVTGNRVTNLKPEFERAPDQRFRIESLDVPRSDDDNFGWRVRGYLLAPYSGVYRFNITGDDWVEAFLSTDETPENKELLCLSISATAEYEWDRDPEYQLSRPIIMKKGERRYFEIRFKESGWRDHFALAWLCPRHPDYEIIRGAYLAPFIVGDGEAPVITLTGAEDITLNVDDEFVDPGFIATGGSGVDLSGDVRVEGHVDTSVAGTYQLRYFLTDENGTEAEVAARKIVVQVAEIGAATYLPDQGTTHPPATWTEPDNQISEHEASRFLIQSTFGPTDASIAAVQNLGYETWLDQQISLPASLHLPELDQFASLRGGQHSVVDNTRATPPLFEMMPSDGVPMASVSHDDRIHSWWTHAIDGDDQLRQRVAFALSEIVVISDYNPVLERYPRGVTNYYDILVRHAFGNYRDLLEEVTLNPMMGFYLTMLRSDKASPDENYGREVMQLFTIGLEELNLDGTKKLDAQGNRQSTYGQSEVHETSRAFTGWTFNNSDEFHRSNGAIDSMNPMIPFPEYHDTGSKTIANGVVIPAGQTPHEDVKVVLDTLFNHPNVAPFLARRLIQRLVTSNPSPGYIYRVSSAFEDDGTGVRGNLGAMVKAILLDPEARDVAALDPIKSGQLREPIIRATHLIRAFREQPTSNPPVFGRFPLENPYFEIREAPLWAVSVFNFFEPDFQVPGILMDAGLYSPEFQITNEVSVVDGSNYFFNSIRYGFELDYGQSRRQPINMDSIDLTNVDLDTLMERIEKLLLARPMSAETRAAFTSLAQSYQDNNETEEFHRALLQVLMAAPEFVILR